ncbi:MAG TPA: hypothetical protein VGR15_07405 [Bacteroidota bacterium]|nr:hypothetical protein [Bacteroidota bacterium]
MKAVQELVKENKDLLTKNDEMNKRLTKLEAMLMGLPVAEERP